MEESALGNHAAKFPSSPVMRTVFCTSGGVFGAVVLKALVNDPDLNIVGLVRSSRVFRPEFGFIRGAANFFCRCGVLYTVYIWLITTAAEFLGLILGNEGASVGVVARRRKIPQLITRNVNSVEGREFLGSIYPELLVTAHFDQKLDPDLCDGKNYAAVNLHPSLLPMHRGVEPVVQSLLSNASVTGISLHRLSEKIDQGRILNAKRVAKNVSESAFSLGCSLMEEGGRLLIASKPVLLDRTSGMPQEEGGSYESWPRATEILSLYRKGGALIRFRDIPRLFG